VIARAFVAVALAGVPILSSAQGPSWNYAQYGHVDVDLASDLESHGETAEISLSLPGAWLVFATGNVLELHDHNAGVDNDRIEGGRLGIGGHTTIGTEQWFALISYVSEKHAGQERSEGGAFSTGVRWLATPWMSFEPEVVWAFTNRSDSDDTNFDQIVRAQVVLRVVPQVWIFGGYSSSLFDYSRSASAGLRFTFGDKAPTRRPGAKAAGPASQPDGPLQVGQTLVALRSLVLQQRPAFGAAEIAVIPQGATLLLLETSENDFGGWWKVSTDNREGWIREAHLK